MNWLFGHVLQLVVVKNSLSLNSFSVFFFLVFLVISFFKIVCWKEEDKFFSFHLLTAYNRSQTHISNSINFIFLVFVSLLLGCELGTPSLLFGVLYITLKPLLFSNLFRSTMKQNQNNQISKWFAKRKKDLTNHFNRMLWFLSIPMLSFYMDLKKWQFFPPNKTVDVSVNQMTVDDIPSFESNVHIYDKSSLGILVPGYFTDSPLFQWYVIRWFLFPSYKSLKHMEFIYKKRKSLLLHPLQNSIIKMIIESWFFHSFSFQCMSLYTINFFFSQYFFSLPPSKEKLYSYWFKHRNNEMWTKSNECRKKRIHAIN